MATFFAFCLELSTNLTDIVSCNSSATFLPILLAPAIITLLELDIEIPIDDNNGLRFFNLTKKNTESPGSNLNEAGGIVIFSSLTTDTIKDLNSVLFL